MFTEPDIAVVNVCAAVLPLSRVVAGEGTRREARGRKGKGGKERGRRIMRWEGKEEKLGHHGN